MQSNFPFTSATCLPSPLEQLFSTAKSNGFMRPILRTSGFKFRLAPAFGKNPDAVYVTETESDSYIGKIKHGQFFPLSASTGQLYAKAVIEVMNNPQEELLKYGQKTGQCAVCGRPLHNAISIYNHIGPICAEKLGIPLKSVPVEQINTDML